MTLTLEHVPVIHVENGDHCIILPCCGKTLLLPAELEPVVCRSCHREISDNDDLASESLVCARCYTA